MIKPSDIQSKEFTISKKGYAEEEVDEFLDILTEDMDELIRENVLLKQKVRSLTNDVQQFRGSEQSVYKSVDTAKQLIEEISKSADKHAELIIKNAQIEAESIIMEAKNSVTRITEDARTMNMQWASFKQRYKRMLLDEIERFEAIGEEFIQEKDILDIDGLHGDPLDLFKTYNDQASSASTSFDTLSPSKIPTSNSSNASNTQIFDKTIRK
ncbi:MAG: DivIVA domain-containing protein [Clostridiales Family XIII bacterium]|jgi:cell division initiation protein|nr:DivIVA domain-containing protein [Clostridiales Family XIII bacterium]